LIWQIQIFQNSQSLE